MSFFAVSYLQCEAALFSWYLVVEDFCLSFAISSNFEVDLIKGRVGISDFARLGLRCLLLKLKILGKIHTFIGIRDVFLFLFSFFA